MYKIIEFVQESEFCNRLDRFVVFILLQDQIAKRRFQRK